MGCPPRVERYPQASSGQGYSELEIDERLVPGFAHALVVLVRKFGR